DLLVVFSDFNRKTYNVFDLLDQREYYIDYTRQRQDVESRATLTIFQSEDGRYYSILESTNSSQFLTNRLQLTLNEGTNSLDFYNLSDNVVIEYGSNISAIQVENSDFFITTFYSPSGSILLESFKSREEGIQGTLNIGGDVEIGDYGLQTISQTQDGGLLISLVLFNFLGRESQTSALLKLSRSEADQLLGR
ncbi:MAG: hypothetical protein AAF740_09770, partial [Bacteroidota bacterium]